jgi:hypothetical protein
MKAMKLLNGYICEKALPFDKISQFFSQNAEVGKIQPEMNDAYE